MSDSWNIDDLEKAILKMEDCFQLESFTEKYDGLNFLQGSAQKIALDLADYSKITKEEYQEYSNVINKKYQEIADLLKRSSF